MLAYLLAAGKAERMFPYSAITEKCMLPIGGKPIVRIIVEQLLESKIVQEFEITISTLPVHEDIIKHEFRDLPAVKVKTIPHSPNTASHYQIVSERDHVHPEEDVLVHYTDNISAIDYKKFAEEYYRATSSNTLIKCAIAGTILIKHDYSAIKFKSKLAQFLDYNELMHADDATKFFDIVTEFVEKPYLGDRGWMGMTMFKHGSMLEAIKSVQKDSVDFGFDVFPLMIAKGQIILHKHEGEWFDVGNVTSYMKLRKRMAIGEKIV